MAAAHPSKPADPVSVLVHNADPTSRSKAHQELGRRAMARDDKTMAAFHFKEALDLDPTDEVTAEELRRVTPVVSKSLLARIFGRS